MTDIRYIVETPGQHFLTETGPTVKPAPENWSTMRVRIATVLVASKTKFCMMSEARAPNNEMLTDQAKENHLCVPGDFNVDIPINAEAVLTREMVRSESGFAKCRAVKIQTVLSS